MMMLRDIKRRTPSCGENGNYRTNKDHLKRRKMIYAQAFADNLPLKDKDESFARVHDEAKREWERIQNGVLKYDAVISKDYGFWNHILSKPCTCPYVCGHCTRTEAPIHECEKDCIAYAEKNKEESC